MRIKIARVVCAFVLFVSGTAFADTFNITQIDNSMLLITQEVRAYLSLLDENGKSISNLDIGNLKVFEDGKEVKINSLSKGANNTEGITLLFLLDNSGSMYDDGEGKPTKDDSQRRITFVKDAIQSLLEQIKNPKDRVGLLSFNVKLGSIVKPTNEKIQIEKALPDVTRPATEEAYTELYETLNASASYFESTSGRKVIILLSDGQDYPLANNPNFPVRTGLSDAIKNVQKQGISVFTIGLSKSADNASLERIAKETGGVFKNADRPEELDNLYKDIREQILNEYLLTYNATMSPAEQRTVKVDYSLAGKSGSAQGTYFSETIFGKPQGEFNFLILLAIPLALILLFLLTLIKFKKKDATASLNLLATAGKKGTTQAFTIAEDQKEITIGGSRDNDFTIQGDRSVTAGGGATIKKKDGEYTLISEDSPVTVNKKQVKTKVLRSGDVITIGNTTIVFDEGVAKTALRDREKKGKK
jgi:Ca-activated chloride channel family protein